MMACFLLASLPRKVLNKIKEQALQCPSRSSGLAALSALLQMRVSEFVIAYVQKIFFPSMTSKPIEGFNRDFSNFLSVFTFKAR